MVIVIVFVLVVVCEGVRNGQRVFVIMCCVVSVDAPELPAGRLSRPPVGGSLK